MYWYSYSSFVYVFKFFNSVLTLGKTSESDLADKVYELILELNRISCPVLLSVLPQLEYKLKVCTLVHWIEGVYM